MQTCTGWLKRKKSSLPIYRKSPGCRLYQWTLSPWDMLTRKPVTRGLSGCWRIPAVILEYPYQRMVSGAGHDAQAMASICPAAMIFIPSKDGVSHSPAEYSSPEDLERGANVLLQAALRLAQSEK